PSISNSSTALQALDRSGSGWDSRATILPGAKPPGLDRIAGPVRFPTITQLGLRKFAVVRLSVVSQSFHFA
ncbi:MAG: hypothetical protein AAGG44_14920, partial [Planctomycetota bacterium]